MMHDPVMVCGHLPFMVCDYVMIHDPVVVWSHPPFMVCDCVMS